jgi:alpha-N-arabinofuranosidase
MKLWRNHYAPDRIALSGNLTSLNIIATRSANAATIYIKTVNANVYPVNIKLNVNDHFNVAKANFKFVTADSLTEENFMDHPHLIRIRNGVVKKSEHQIMVTVPGWSASVLTVKNR